MAVLRGRSGAGLDRDVVLRKASPSRRWVCSQRLLPISEWVGEMSSRCGGIGSGSGLGEQYGVGWSAMNLKGGMLSLSRV